MPLKHIQALHGKKLRFYLLTELLEPQDFGPHTQRAWKPKHPKGMIGFALLITKTPNGYENHQRLKSPAIGVTTQIMTIGSVGGKWTIFLK